MYEAKMSEYEETKSNHTLTSKLKSIYSEQDVIPKLIEDDSIPTQKMEEYYVKLNMMLNNKRESDDKNPIEVKNLFDAVHDKPAANKLLITGPAGVGKTTFLHHIAYEWGKDRLFSDKFDYVFKVKLKLLLNEDWKHGHESSDLRSNPLACFIFYYVQNESIGIEEIKEALSNKERTLLLLDGYDEVSHMDIKNARSQRTDFTPWKLEEGLLDSIYDFRYVVVTSRPNAITTIREREFDRIVENAGFDRENAIEYVEKYFDGQSKNIEQEFEEFTNLEEFISLTRIREYFTVEGKNNICNIVSEIYTKNQQVRVCDIIQDVRNYYNNIKQGHLIKFFEQSLNLVFFHPNRTFFLVPQLTDV